MDDVGNRRPVKSRSSAWAASLAGALARARVSPDLISAMSVAFALVGFGAFALSGLSDGWTRVVWLGLALITIQLRLICNIIDGLVAVEHGKGGPAGPIWNELPDRLSDALFLVGAGYAAMPASESLGPALGWLCAVLAVMTAYVRELGRGLGLPADFSGPLAKPQRMGLLSAAAVLSMFEGLWDGRGQVMLWGLGLAAALVALTVFNRTRNLARGLSGRA